MNDNDKTTRREMLKTAAFGAGLLLCGCGRKGHAQGGGRRGPLPIAANNPSIQHHASRCKQCGKCRDFCKNTTTVFGSAVPPGEEACIRCGQCTTYCRVLTEKYHYPEVMKAVAASDKITVASTSPALRVALGEMYRMAAGTNVEGKIVGAMKRLGVDYVLDTTFAADVTIMEEAAELLRRLKDKDAKLPMFTSCCPAWVRFAKLFYPWAMPHISSVKSPVMMQGALVKTYFAWKMKIDPAKIVHVALTPCTAKKAEILLPGKSAMRDVDIALTCREIAYLLNDAKVDFLKTADAAYDSLMGAGSGAGMIFGNTGGVMEAALRTAYKVLNDKNPPANFLELRAVRGSSNIRQATVDLGVRKLNVAVVHGIGRVRPLLESIRTGAKKFDFVEVMACPGGCVGGGGQPIASAQARQLRANALYQRDAKHPVRLSCDNPEVKAVYAEFLGEPMGEMAERLLHVGR